MHTNVSTLLPAVNPSVPYNGGGINKNFALELLHIWNSDLDMFMIDCNWWKIKQWSIATLTAANLYAISVSRSDVSELIVIAKDHSLPTILIAQ